jgi:hypothetical protein
MLRKFPSLPILLALVLLLVASLACRLPGLSRADPTPAPVPVSSEAVEDLMAEIESAGATASAGGPIVLELTETQLTSLAALELQNQQEVGIQNLQIRLQNGQVMISGNVAQDSISLPIGVDLNIYVEAGEPRTEIVSAKLGPLPVPQAYLDQITEQFNQALISQFSSYGQDIVFDSISIQNGIMTITAHTQ